jgi:hypothetical protein
VDLDDCRVVPEGGFLRWCGESAGFGDRGGVEAAELTRERQSVTFDGPVLWVSRPRVSMRMNRSTPRAAIS